MFLGIFQHGGFFAEALEAVENEVKSRGQTLHYRVVGDLRLHDKIIQALEEVEHKLHEALENGSDADHGTHGTHAHVMLMAMMVPMLMEAMAAIRISYLPA